MLKFSSFIDMSAFQNWIGNYQKHNCFYMVEQRLTDTIFFLLSKSNRSESWIHELSFSDSYFYIVE